VQHNRECTIITVPDARYKQRQVQIRRTPLMQAVALNDLKSFNILRIAGVPINQRNSLGCTALHTAASRLENVDMVAHLINAGADVDSTTSQGMTPLMFAAAYNVRSTVCVYALSLTQSDSDGRRPSLADSAASEQCHDSQTVPVIVSDTKSDAGTSLIVRTLVEAGGDINATCKGWTPLMYAARYQIDSTAAQVIHTLIDVGANVNATEQSGWTALMTVAQYNHKAGPGAAADVFRTLLDAGADVNASTNDGVATLSTLIRYNTTSSATELIGILLDAGADVNARNLDGVTPLMCAVQYNDTATVVEVIRILIDAGADVNATNTTGWTPLMQAAMCNTTATVLKVIRVLIEAGADVNASNSAGWTPLMHAAANHSSHDVVRLLLDAHARVNATSSNGYTVLMQAARYNDSVEVMQQILFAGAQVNIASPDGWTALLFAVRRNTNLDVIETLLGFGATINAKLSNGSTAESLATANKHVDVHQRMQIQKLLERTKQGILPELKLPQELDIHTWNCERIHEWVLSEPWLAPYDSIFVEEKIDGEVLANLTKEEFRSLLPDGTPFGDVSKAWLVLQRKQHNKPYAAVPTVNLGSTVLQQQDPALHMQQKQQRQQQRDVKMQHQQQAVVEAHQGKHQALQLQRVEEEQDQHEEEAVDGEQQQQQRDWQE
jgi:ankyrin repeat protein